MDNYSWQSIIKSIFKQHRATETVSGESQAPSQAGSSQHKPALE